MANAATIFWEVEATGSDTNGGGFDPNQTANMKTDGAATVANTGSPVFTSASYTFVAGDVGAWLYISSGTNWIVGWYKIASVSAGAVTLSAAIGAGVLASTLRPTTATGCATVASPTAARWTVDYSQQSAPYTTFSIISTTATIGVASLVGGGAYINLIGNLIFITGGGATTGWYTILNATTSTLTLDRSPGASVAAATGAAGGALASVGQAGANMVSGNTTWCQSGAYSITSATVNVSGGCISMTAAAATPMTLIGYGSVRGDYGTKPVLTASGITTFKVVQLGAAVIVDNISVNGASLTGSTAFQGNGLETEIIRCRASNCVAGGYASPGSATAVVLDCVAVNCTTIAAFIALTCIGCDAVGGTIGFSSGGGAMNLTDCMAVNCTGVGFTQSTSTGIFAVNCTAVGCGGNGFFSSSINGIFVNCIAESCGAFGFACSGNGVLTKLYNCATYNNTSGSTSTILQSGIFGLIQYSGSAFVNAAASPPNLNLNNTAGAGALLRAASFVGVFPTPTDITATSFRDLGAAQSQASAGSSGVIGNSPWMSGGFQG